MLSETLQGVWGVLSTSHPSPCLALPQTLTFRFVWPHCVLKYKLIFSNISTFNILRRLLYYIQKLLYGCIIIYWTCSPILECYKWYGDEYLHRHKDKFPVYWLFREVHTGSERPPSSYARMEKHTRHGCPCTCHAHAGKPGLTTGTCIHSWFSIQKPNKAQYCFHLQLLILSIVCKLYHLYFFSC